MVNAQQARVLLAVATVSLSPLACSAANAQQAHKIAWSCAGEGQPTMIQIAGSGLPIATRTTHCRKDRSADLQFRAPRRALLFAHLQRL